MHVHRSKTGVAGPKAGTVVEARARANTAKVYPFDPLDQRPERAPTIAQRHAASRHPAEHGKTRYEGREKSRIPRPFNYAQIRANKLRPALDKTYNQRKRVEDLPPYGHESYGKYLDSKAH